MDLEQAAKAWSDVADAWDRNVDYVDEHSAEATDRLLDRVAVRPGDRVLELATGPGTLGPTLVELVGDDGSVVLSDLAPGMVEVAGRRNASRPNVTCDVIDVAAIDRPDGSFDVVVCRMGLMFAPDPAAAFAEIRRVLAEGGRLGAMTWGRLEENPWMTTMGMSAAMAGITSGGPPVGPGSIFSLGDPDEVTALVEGAGFRNVTVESVDVVFRSPDLDTHLTRVGSLAGPMAAEIAAATPEQKAKMREIAAGIAAPHTGEDGSVGLPARMLLITGAR